MTVREAAALDVESFRGELTGFCYRMLGSGFEAEDAVQETMIKALGGGAELRSPAALRSWLYRIATNVCIDMCRAVQRRARPMDLGPASPADESLLGLPLTEALWVTPLPDRALGADPAEIAAQRDSVRLAFITALQHLPGRQRAALILCDVLRFAAADVAGMLSCSVAAVNSATQRARATLRALPPAGREPLDATNRRVLDQYVAAFESYDIAALVTLLHADAVQSMPPFALWLQGATTITEFMLQPGPSLCRGSKLVATNANGCPAFGQYKPSAGGGYEPWAIQILEFRAGKISELAFFLNLLDPPRLFSQFGLPAHLDG